ncbi:AsmA family protein [Hyphomicrobium sp. MC8b]|uniref:AsmA family protein n=1 Tax=Hyphomicrobium sp. MC8b TaxID=300273 RepID=UPI00391BE381
MNNGLLFLGGLLVAIFAALFAVPNFIDWNSYRGVFEEEASKVLSRDVRVGGNVNLKILPVPYVRFEKVRIASVSGQTGQPFIRADSFTMWLSVAAMLRGVLEASQIELEKPVLSLSVDDKGVGNWSKIELRAGDLPFVPRDVALRSVQITDGAVSIYNAASEQIAAVDGIDGVFSADGIRGPFRFNGSASWAGTEHDVKFATDVPASDGAFALKLSARTDHSPNVLTLDGRVYNASEKTTFKGRWTGKVQVPGSPTVEPNGKAPPPLIDLRSDVTADALAAKLENLTLTLDNAAEPQTITGAAVASWSPSPRLDVTLNSKWLDIDWLAGAGKGGAGFSKLRQLALGLMQSVAGDSQASAKINLEQVKIGGENAGGLSIDAERQGSVTHLKTFKVSLPGGSRLDLAGDLRSKDGKLSFLGRGFIGGASFGRFKAWADKSGIPIDVNADGAYSAAGKLEIDDKRFFLTDASGDISGKPLAGELKVTHGDRERTELMLQAADLDTQVVFPKISQALRSEFRKSLGLASRKDDRKADEDLPSDVRLRVIAGRLTDGQDSYRDVDVSFAIQGRKVSLPVAKLTTDSGLEIGLEGRIETQDSGPVGTLAYDLVGPSADAMRDLIRKAGLLDVVGEDRFGGLKDGKIAGLVRLGLRGPKTADLTFDGLLDGSKFDGRAEFDGGIANWRTQPSRLQATLDAPTLSGLLATLGRDSSGIAAESQKPALASLLTSGTLGSGAVSQIEISSQDFDMRFRGRAQWPDTSDLALNGLLNVKAAQSAQAFAVAGLSLPGGLTAVPLQGTLDLHRDKGAWIVTAQNVSLGESLLSGRVTAATASGATKIDGNIFANRVMVPALLSAVTDAPSTVPVSAAPSAPNPNAVNGAAVAQVWPEGLFDFAALGNTMVALKVGFKSLGLSEGLATGDGTMMVALAPGKLSITDIKAAAAGGQFAGYASLEKVSNGVAFASELKLDDVKLATLNSGGKGSGAFELHTEARAQSPAGLIAVMTGSGTATLSGAGLTGPSPTAVTNVVDDVISGTVQNDPSSIANALVSEVGSSELALGDRKLAISVSDGTLKLSNIDLRSVVGTAEGAVSADLATLGMSASFQLTSVVPPALAPAAQTAKRKAAATTKSELPAAIVLYSGELGRLASLSVSADVSDLQRELAVRQMERNVEQLEQARRADEERARLQKEMDVKRKEAADRAAAQQRIQQQQLPPVIPESAGTAAPSQGTSENDPDDFFGSTPPTSRAGQQPYNRSTLEPQPQNLNGQARNAASGGQTAVGQPAAIDPATGLPVPKPVPAVKPTVTRTTLPPKPVKRRTSADEMMKSFGGYP